MAQNLFGGWLASSLARASVARYVDACVCVYRRGALHLSFSPTYCKVYTPRARVSLIRDDCVSPIKTGSFLRNTVVVIFMMMMVVVEVMSDCRQIFW